MLQTGILDRTKIVSNVLLIVLLCGNIYFSVQYIYSLKETKTTDNQEQVTRIQANGFLKLFIQKVLQTSGTITYNDRILLESDVVRLGDQGISIAWKAFVDSKTPTDAQTKAIDLMLKVVSKIQATDRNTDLIYVD